MAKEEEHNNYEEVEGEEERDGAASALPLLELTPYEWRTCERIEKVASVVARSPSVELFFMQLMHGDRDFDFMSPGHECYSYYCNRVDQHRTKRRPPYSLYG